MLEILEGVAAFPEMSFDPLSKCLVLQGRKMGLGGILGCHGTRRGQWAAGILVD